MCRADRSVGRGMIFALVVMGIVLLVLWLGVLTEWRGSREPAAPHEPWREIDELAQDWSSSPSHAADWFGFSAEKSSAEIQIARIESRAGYQDEDTGVHVQLSLRLPTGRSVTGPWVRVNHAWRRSRPGTLLPVRVEADRDGERVLVAGPAPADARRLLLAHRLDRGLLDETGYEVLATGRPETVAARTIRPTGRVLLGHVEVTMTFTDPGGELGTATGFLRPDELTVARCTGALPAHRDDNGRWALRPGWY